MQVFKTAIRSFFRHPIYLLVYVVWLSCMGLFMGMSVNELPEDEYFERPSVAVINRDEGELAQGLASFLLESADAVDVADNERALQDAVMQQRAHYIAIIPDGFTSSFLDAARAGDESALPVVQTVETSSAAAIVMMDNLVNEYLNVARSYALAIPDSGAAAIVERTKKAMGHAASVHVVPIENGAPASGGMMLYLQFASYTLLLSIGICTAVIMAQFGRDEVRRRNLSSPLSVLSSNFQLAAACFVVMLICWAFVAALGFAVYGSRMAGMSAGAVAGVLGALLCYALFALSFGFLIGQLTHNELMMNAAANITGLVMSFLGGAWVPLELVGEPITTLAKFMPTYYYIESLKASFEATGAVPPSGSLAGMGVVLLFAVALFAIGLAIGRLRLARIGAWNGLSTRASSQPAA